MDEDMKLYWETISEEVSTESIIRNSMNPLREYELDFIEGPIIDIGCGQSNFLLDYAQTKRKIFAIDNEKLQLEWLESRVKSIDGANLSNWSFLNLQFPEEELPNENYSVIILSNILHFYSMEDCLPLINILDKNLVTNSMIYVVVHSYKHYANDEKDPYRLSYFKHYFKIEDLHSLFPSDKFEYLYTAEVEKINSQEEVRITSLWLDKCNKKDNVTNPEIASAIKTGYLKNNKQSQIQMIFKRK